MPKHAHALSLVALCLVIALLYPAASWASTPPKLEDIFGVWEVEGKVFFEARIGQEGTAEALEAMIGKRIELRADYLVVDGKQYNCPDYICRVYPSPGALCDDLQSYYQLKTKEGPMLSVDFEDYASYLIYYEKEFEDEYTLRRIVVDQDRLILETGGHTLSMKRCAGPSLWQRAYAYLKRWLTPESYNPYKIVGKGVFGLWEVCAVEAFPEDSRETEAVEAAASDYLGKQVALQPYYLVLDGIRYEKPRYWRPYNKFSKRFVERINLDRHNDYHMLGRPCNKIYTHIYLKLKGKHLRMSIKNYLLTLKRVA